SLIDEFWYPRLGPGQMWERFRERVEERGGEVRLNTPVQAVHCEGPRVCSLRVGGEGQGAEVPASQVISSMPVSQLVTLLRPEPPPEVLEAARGLKYRDFILVALVVDRAELFPDNWIYVHTPQVRVGRIQNFKNWSAAMVPDPSKTCVGM